MNVGRGRYAIACNEDGGLFMDGILFRLEENRFWYVQPDGALETWLMAHKSRYDVNISDPHSRVIQIQGPKSLEVITNSLINSTERCEYVEWNPDLMSGKLLAVPQREQIAENIKEQLIVELYSK